MDQAGGYGGVGPDEPPVVVGADGMATALRAVGWAATEARLRDDALRIVHAAPYATDAAAPGAERTGPVAAAPGSARVRGPHDRHQPW